MCLVPSLLACGQGFANVLRSAELTGFCLCPTFINLAAGVCPPSLLVLQQAQRFAHHVVCRLKIAGGHFTPHEFLKRQRKTDIHGSSVIDVSAIVKSPSIPPLRKATRHECH